MSKELIPVLHIDNNTDIIGSMKLLNSLDIKKVFFISHGYLNYKELIEVIKEIKSKFENFWIGVNFLDVKASDVFRINKEELSIVDAIWIDNSFAGISNAVAKGISIDRNKNFKGMYFGGVAFKYCPQPSNLKYAVEQAIELMDVITTSGKGTGIEAEIEKIAEMSQYAQNKKPLAIASGITANNIDKYLPYVKYFLVGTFIEKGPGIFDKDKIVLLKNKIDNFNKNGEN